MTPDQSNPFYTHYGKSISIQHIKKNTALPFKNHVQFPMIVDVLSRKYHHHLILRTHFSPDLYLYFMEALVSYLSQETIPFPLRRAELIYIDTATLPSKILPEVMENDFLNLSNRRSPAEKYILLILSSMKHALQLKTLLAHPKIRLMAFTNAQKNKLRNPLASDLFSLVDVTGPNETDIAAVLKSQRKELEQFHKTLIPEELLGQAYSLAERYLSTRYPLEKALQLLDSSCARQAALETSENPTQFKSTLTMPTLTSVLSHWIQIPTANLSLGKFKLGEFTQDMNQKIFGQDTAITLLGHELQQSQVQAKAKSKPFYSLLFAGPNHAGKRSTAIALTEQLFGQLGVLYFAQPPYPAISSFIDLPLLCCHDQQRQSLKALIETMPYAVILFEHIDKAPPALVAGIQEILSTGRFHGTDNTPYDFRQAIVILSTTLGTSHLLEMAKSFLPTEGNDNLDLIQLIMSEKKPSFFSSHHDTPQTIAAELKAKLSNDLPSLMCQSLSVIPFLPLHANDIEKIIQLKLKILIAELDARHQIELHYAPEVVRYITNDVMKKARAEQTNTGADIDHGLKQLYYTVEQTVLSQTDSQKRYGQLFLQLNDTGNVLRCDWLASAPLTSSSP